jgi:hypothetical protein
VEIVRDLDLAASARRTFEFVDDLGRYPSWMRLVHEATPAPSVDGDPPGSSAWFVVLQAQVGPFARSKRLRMIRTVHQPPRRVRFERREIDGRSHAAWELDVILTGTDEDGTDPHDAVAEDEARTRLVMTLSYGGRLWTGAVLQRVLDDEVTRGSDALVRLVATG